MPTTAPDTPTTSRKRGRPRDTDKLVRVLEALRGDPTMFFEYGGPPYNVADIAERLEMDASNLRAYLLVLERDGLVVRERRHHQIWNAIARDHQDRMVLCFWNATTMEQDRAATDTWNAGTSERAAGARAAFDRMFAPQPGPTPATALPTNCIDVVARVVPTLPKVDKGLPCLLRA